MARRPIWTRRFYAQTMMGPAKLASKTETEALEEAKKVGSSYALIEERTKLVAEWKRG